MKDSAMKMRWARENGRKSERAGDRERFPVRDGRLARGHHLVATWSRNFSFSGLFHAGLSVPTVSRWLGSTPGCYSRGYKGKILNVRNHAEGTREGWWGQRERRRNQLEYRVIRWPRSGSNQVRSRNVWTVNTELCLLNIKKEKKIIFSRTNFLLSVVISYQSSRGKFRISFPKPVNLITRII